MKVADGVYAAGDVARFPYAPLGESIRVEHYGYAQQQGRCCAANIAGEHRVCSTVPFFWTAQYGKNLRYAGHGAGFDDVLIDGDLDALNFTAIYAKGDKVIAVATMGRDQQCAAAAELLGMDAMPPVSAWKNLTRRKVAPDFVELLRK